MERRVEGRRGEGTKRGIKKRRRMTYDGERGSGEQGAEGVREGQNEGLWNREEDDDQRDAEK